jgi:hypothetical protein
VSISPEKTEEVINDLLQKLPEKISLYDMRNIICELLFGMGMNPEDLPIFLILVVDGYMGNRSVDLLKKR